MIIRSSGEDGVTSRPGPMLQDGYGDAQGPVDWTPGLLLALPCVRLMPRYYFDTDDGNRFRRDVIGQDLDGPETARRAALEALADLARDALPEDGDKRLMIVRVRDAEGPVCLESFSVPAGRAVGRAQGSHGPRVGRRAVGACTAVHERKGVRGAEARLEYRAARLNGSAGASTIDANHAALRKAFAPGVGVSISTLPLAARRYSGPVTARPLIHQLQ